MFQVLHDRIDSSTIKNITKIYLFHMVQMEKIQYFIFYVLNDHIEGIENKNILKKYFFHMNH